MAHLRMPMNGRLFAQGTRRWTATATGVPKPNVLHTSNLFRCGPSMRFTGPSVGQVPAQTQLFHTSAAVCLPRSFSDSLSRSFSDSKQSTSEAGSLPRHPRENHATPPLRTRAKLDSSTHDRPENSISDGQRRGSSEGNLYGPATHLTSKSLAKIFAVLGGIFIASACWSDLKAREIEEKVTKRAFESSNAVASLFSPFVRLFNTLGLADERVEIKELRNAWAQTKAARAGEIYKSLMDSLSNAPDTIQDAVSRSWLGLIEWHTNLPVHRQAVLPILLINASIFLSWRYGSLRSFLTRYFLDFAVPKRHATRSQIFPMIGANFSHRSFIHFAFNNLALWSFGALAFDKLYSRRGATHHDDDNDDRDRRRLASVTYPWHEVDLTAEVIGFCVCAGLVATFFSRTSRLLHHRRLVNELRTLAKSTYDPNAPGKLDVLRQAVYQNRRQYSLGFSGVMYAVIVMTAFNCPDVRIGVLFLPGVNLSIQDGVLGMVVIDLACLLLFPKSPLDHAAHVGGAVFGFWWYTMGERWWVAVRDWFHRMADGESEHEGRWRQLQ